jgi:hypothetical protein
LINKNHRGRIFMNRKIVALLLVFSMLLGIFSLAAAQGAGFGRPDSEEDPPFGPPEFSDGLNRLGIRHTVMSRNRVLVNNHPLESDLPPVIIDGRILIPVRAVCVALGAEVVWDAINNTITITREGIEVVIVVGNGTITVDGLPFEIDVPAQILGNRTFVPLRFIAIALGDIVEWNPLAGEAYIRRGRPVTSQDE